MTDIPNSRKSTPRRKIGKRFIQAWVDKKTGHVYCYFRRAGYPRVPLPGLPGSAELEAAYAAALGNAPSEIGIGRNQHGSVAHAVASYFGSTDFCNRLTPSTQASAACCWKNFAATTARPIASLPRKFIETLLSTLRPGAEKNWLKALRGLLQYCVAEGLCKEDVTASIKLAPSTSKGFHGWTDDEIARFEAHHPVGSKPRLAHALLLYTGQRRGDVIRMGRRHIKDGVLTITQQKTGVAVAVPVHPELRAAIDASAGTNLTFLVTDRGRLGSIATTRACRSAASCTGCAKRRAASWRKPDAPRTRSWASLATRRSRKPSATPRISTARSWRARGWRD